MRRIIIFIIILFLFAIGVNSRTIWVEKDIYVADKNVKVGDIVVVHVRDFSKLKFDVSVVNNSSSNIISNPDVTITGFLPKVSSNKSSKNNDSTNFTGNSKIDLAIAARIVEVQNNGYSVINGSRTYSLNGITNVFTVSGVIDPKMISGGAIDSMLVADFRIQITGRKEGLTIRKNQIGADEKASAELTEQEKQQIIIDYLEKIIRELTK